MSSFELRNRESFLRNFYKGTGKYELPYIYKQNVDFENLKFIGFHNIRKENLSDKEKQENCSDKEKTVHFFLDDYKFERVWKEPERYVDRVKRFKQILSPDFSVYSNMQTWMKIHNTGKKRYCSAFWQSKGLVVIPAVNWGGKDTFDFCFDSIEIGCIVAVSAMGSGSDKEKWLAGFRAMCKALKPEKVICYTHPVPEAFESADIIVIDHEGDTARQSVKNFVPGQRELF